VVNIDEAIKDLASYEANEDMSPEVFKAAHLRIKELNPKIKAIVDGLSAGQKKTFEKRAEKKVTRAKTLHHEKLQKQLDELTSQMPDNQK
jgi:hypothetical protein